MLRYSKERSDIMAKTAKMMMIMVVAVGMMMTMIEQVDAFGARLEPSHTTTTTSTTRRRTSRPDIVLLHSHHLDRLFDGSDDDSSSNKSSRTDQNPKNQGQIDVSTSSEIVPEPLPLNTLFINGGEESILSSPSYDFLQDEADILAVDAFLVEPPPSPITANDHDDIDEDHEECEIPSEWKKIPFSDISSFFSSKIEMTDVRSTLPSIAGDDDSHKEGVIDVLALLGITRAEPLRVPNKNTRMTMSVHIDEQFLEGEWQ